MTLKEIADLAGVSIGTVDRVLHNRGRVSKENTEKIHDIVRKYGYEPNKLAQRLQSGKAIKIGVLLPSIVTEFGYWQQVMDGTVEAEKELNSVGIKVITSFFDRDEPESFLSALAVLVEADVIAYITAPVLPDMMRKANELYPDLPFVFIDSSLPDLSPLADFAQDPIKAGKIAARMMHMMNPDLMRIFVIQTFRSAFNGEMRARSFIDYYRRSNPRARVENLYIRSDEMLEPYLTNLTFKEGEKGGMFIVSDGAWRTSEKLEELDLLDKFLLIGFDLSPENREMLENGRISLIIGQRPWLQGYESVMFVYKGFVLGRPIKKETLSVPVDIYLKENIPQSSLWG